MTKSLTLFSGLVVKKPFDDAVVPAFTAQHGCAVNAVYDPTVELLKQIDQGATFDVMIGATPSFAPLIERGIVEPTITPFLRTGIGLAVGPGAPKPDISTVEALTKALVDARSVAFSQSGQSGIYFQELIQRLGIADEVLAKATALPKGFTAEALIDGRADLAVQQVSELMVVERAELVGFLPEGAQKYTEFSAAIHADAANGDDARRFVDYISGPEAGRAYVDAHLEPIRE